MGVIKFGFGRASLLAAATVLALSQAARADVSYVYDDLGRVTSIQYDDGRLVSYSYDAAGNRTQHVVSQGGNRSPIALDDAMSVDVVSGYTDQIDPRSNDHDPDFNALTVTGAANGSQGTVAILLSGTQVRYTYTGPDPGVGQQTSDTFTYTVSDGAGGSATATIHVDILNSGTGGGDNCGGPGQPQCP